MHRTRAIGLLMLLSVAAFGCEAAREAQRAAESAPTADVAGTWTGTAGTGGVTVPVTMNLTQNGTQVGGQVAVGGRPDLSGAVRGTVQGQVVKLSLPTVTLGQMIARDNTMTGEVSAGLPLTLRRVR